MTKTGIVGTFGGLNIPTVTIYMEGFREGVQYYNQEQRQRRQARSAGTAKNGSFTDDFEAKTKGQTVGEQLIQQGADIIFPVAGPAGLGGLQAAKDAKASRHLGRHRRLRIADRVLRHPADLGREGHRHRGDRRDQVRDRRASSATRPTSAPWRTVASGSRPTTTSTSKIPQDLKAKIDAR